MPTTPSISVSDNQDGTATVTVSGGDAGASNVAYWSRFGGNWETFTDWTSGGSRTGNGTIDVTVPQTGVYLFVVQASAGGNTVTTLPIETPVSSAAPDPKTQLIDLIQARVIALSLDGISASRIFTHTFADDFYSQDLSEPCVVISPVGRDSFLSGNRAPSNLDAWEFPVLVAPAAPAGQKQTRVKRAIWFKWVYRIRAALSMKGWHFDDDRVRVVTSRVIPGETVSRRWWELNAFAAPDVFLFEVWTPRGVL